MHIQRTIMGASGSISLGLALFFIFFSSAAAAVISNRPPRGWRSWNQIGGFISQTLMEDMAAAMVDRSRTVDGKPTSLLDLGYDRIGMDDGWQACGTGINGSFHSASGTPLFNTTRFPDVKAMNAKIHGLGLSSDWYINNCECQEKDLLTPGFADAGNAKALPALGFDGVKIDGCGPDRNVTRFAEMVDAASQGKTIMIEDCNDDPAWDRGSEDVSRFYDTGCAVSGGGFYRIAGDIFGNWEAVMGRIQGMAGHMQAVPWHTPLQRPGCWPTPDALEVGCTRQGPLGLNRTESISHFSMWAVTSAPLILGLDLRDKAATDFAWPIITNTEVLAVHAAWPETETEGGAARASLPGAMIATDGTFTAGTIKDVTWQVWAKNVSTDAVAVLLVNAGDAVQDVEVHLDGLVPCRPANQGLCNEQHLEVLCAPPCKGTRLQSGHKLAARDLWARKPLPDVVDGVFIAKQLAPHGSMFVLLNLTAAVV